MAGQSRVGICLDEALGRKIAQVLRTIRAPVSPDIHDIRDFGLGETSDEVLLHELGQRRIAALVTRDSSMLSAATRRDAWRTSGVSVFLCDGRWGNLSLFDQARLLIWWWPALAQQTSTGPQGGAWRIPVETRQTGLQRLFAQASGGHQ
jgi:hypothetical protein